MSDEMKSQMEVNFRQYVANVLKLKSANHYWTAVNTASDHLRAAGQLKGSLFEVTSVSELRRLFDYLSADKAFIAQNKTGHSMYSNGYRHFVEFVNMQASTRTNPVPRLLTAADLSALDAPVDKPLVMPKITLGWNRDRIVVEQVLEAARHECQIDAGHETFIARKNDAPYVEGHHLIPMNKSDQFSKSLDVYANIIALCPTCHRQLHCGRREEIRELLKPIYDLRAERLAKSGIIVSKDEFLALAS